MVEQEWRKTRRYIWEEEYVLAFLDEKCAAGISVACTDAAKVIASQVFNPSTSYNRDIINRKALSQLPSEGALARNPQVAALREKLEQTATKHGWDYLASLFGK